MNKSIAYRPEIDGLRAIAVLSVVLFHARIALPNQDLLLSGGFLGVDVFFVISGFLITAIIRQELATTGSFRFAAFYLRRAKRLLPALFLVILASMPLAWLFLLPQELKEYAQSIGSSVFFYSNFLFWTEDPYWATASELKPLLHTWSLAVEEQYYLIMPLLMVGLYQWRKSLLPWSLLLITGVSLWLAIRFTPMHPEDTFYLLPFRLWEFAIGGLLAVVKTQPTQASLWSRLVMPLSLLALIWSLSTASSETLHPHWMTLIPVLSTAAMIGFSQPQEITTRLLSSNVLVWVGLISYPLYLWHYPIFSFMKASEIETSVGLKLLLIALSVGLAFVTYRWLEKPIRGQGFRFSMPIQAGIFATLAGMLLFAWLGAKTGFHSRLSELYDVYGNIEPSNRILQVATWDTQNETQQFEPNTTRLLIHGDSHARDLYNALDLNRDQAAGLDFVRTRLSFSDNQNKTCFANDAQTMKALLASELYQQADHVLISDFFTNNWHLDCLRQYLAQVDLSHKHHVLFSVQHFDLPEGIDQVETFVDALRQSNRFIDLYYARNPLKIATVVDWVVLSDGRFDFEWGARRQHDSISEKSKRVNTQLAEIATEHGMAYINKYDYLCDPTQSACTVLTDSGHKVYYDRSHFTLSGAGHMGPWIIQSIQDVIAKGSSDHPTD